MKSGNILDHQDWEGVVQLALSGQGLQMRLSTPQCTGRPHGTEKEQPRCQQYQGWEPLV